MRAQGEASWGRVVYTPGMGLSIPSIEQNIAFFFNILKYKMNESFIVKLLYHLNIGILFVKCSFNTNRPKEVNYNIWEIIFLKLHPLCKLIKIESVWICKPIQI